MIVQPDFVDHWKTRQLIDLTGDKSAPLILLRLWGYCQTSKRSFFPDMSSAQLSSICQWGDRKPACYIALVKCRFVERLSPKGFAVHQWHEYNAKLFANWENGKKHTGKQIKENTNETEETLEPVGSVGITQVEPIEQKNLIDQIDQIEGTRTERTMGSKSSVHPFKTKAVPASNHNTPSRNHVIAIMKMTLEDPEATKCGDHWIQEMDDQDWLDDRGAAIRSWTSLATKYAEAWKKNLKKFEPF